MSSCGRDPSADVSAPSTTPADDDDKTPSLLAAAAPPSAPPEQLLVALPATATSCSSSSSSSSPASSPASSSSSSSAAAAISTDPRTAHFRAWAARDPYLLVHKAIFFIGMGACAAYYPYLVMRLRSLGLADYESGVIMAASKAASTVAAPLLSHLADRSARHRRAVLVASFPACALALAVMSQCRGFWACAFGATLVDCALAATYPIVDASLLALLKASRPGGDTSAYSESRAFGGLGWGLYAWASGALYDGDARGLDLMFAASAFALLPAVPFALAMPVELRGTDDDAADAARATEAAAATAAAAAAEREDEGLGATGAVVATSAAASSAAAPPARPASPVARLRAYASALTSGRYAALFSPEALTFFAVVYITAVLLSVCDLYRSPFLSSLGASNELVGLAVTATAVTETPCFLLAGPVLRRVGNTSLVLLVILLAYAARFYAYSVLTDPWWTMPMELLHGVTYAFGWAASCQHVATLLPPELSSTAQGVLSGIQFGLSSLTGALAGGALLSFAGPRTLFRCCIALALVGAAVMAAGMRQAAAKARAAAAAGAGAGTSAGEEAAAVGKEGAAGDGEWAVRGAARAKAEVA